MNKLLNIYKSLLKKYGPQGWWPLLGYNNEKIINNPESQKGYHPGDYSFPKNNRQRFEVCTGAILTQNTAWSNVEKALINLKKGNLLNAKAINEADIDIIKECIRPAGYFNQKSVYLKELSEFFISLKGKIPERNDLLKVKGIGPETADSILLYAYNQPEFIVDNYTKRIFSDLGFFKNSAEYYEVKEVFSGKLPQDIVIYQEFHALIVVHAKINYSRKTVRQTHA